MKVYSILFKQTRYLPLQLALWRANCPSMTEFVVVNNGPDHKDIDRAAYWLDLRTVRVPPAPYGWYGTQQDREQFGCGSPSHAWGIDYTLQTEAPACAEGMMFIDLDLFAFKRFDNPTGQVASWWRQTGGIHFPWAGSLYLGPNLPNRAHVSAKTSRNIPKEQFEHLAPGGLDTGGGVLWHIRDYCSGLHDHGLTGVSEMWSTREFTLHDLSPCRQAYEAIVVKNARDYGFQVIRDCLLHTHSGSGWSGEDHEKDRFIEDLLWRYVHALPAQPVPTDRAVLNILTSVTRPENLPEIAKHIPAEARWWLLLEEPLTETPANVYKTLIVPKARYQGIKLNKALDEIKHGYIWVCDDDNLPHPDFWAELQPRLNTPNKVYFFNMECSDAHTVAQLPPRFGYADTAQVVYDRAVVGDLRHIENSHSHDGAFHEDLYRLRPETWTVIPRTLCYYNKLRGGKS